MNIEHLVWDSEFFAFNTARIVGPDLSRAELAAVLEEARKAGIRLLYWPANAEEDPSWIRQLGGLLADRKAIYAIDLSSGENSRFAFPAVHPYQSMELDPALVKLALQSGEHSRFRRDANFTSAQFEALYRIWIRNSLNRQIADEVLVIREEGRIAGMATLGQKNGAGDIGLLAVDSSCRGKGYGRQLVAAANAAFVGRKLTRAQVVTQADNNAAVALYESCGYHLSRLEYFYHFWL